MGVNKISDGEGECSLFPVDFATPAGFSGVRVPRVPNHLPFERK